MNILAASKIFNRPIVILSTRLKLLIVAALIFQMGFWATDTEAAQITFNPVELSVDIQPGESTTIPIEVNLKDATSSNPFAMLGVSQIGGNFPNTSSSKTPYITLNNNTKAAQTSLNIEAPEDLEPGNYNAIYSAINIRSNERVIPTSLTIQVNVGETATCTKAPAFSEITSSDDVIHTRNNKQVTIEFMGSVTSPEGCSLSDVSYQFSDEYSELDATGQVETEDDGSFTVAVPMVASRKGTDKDGRVYTMTFSATNEAGVKISEETKIVVSHDNRKD